MDRHPLDAGALAGPGGSEGCDDGVLSHHWRGPELRGSAELTECRDYINERIFKTCWFVYTVNSVEKR